MHTRNNKPSSLVKDKLKDKNLFFSYRWLKSYLSNSSGYKNIDELELAQQIINQIAQKKISVAIKLIRQLAENSGEFPRQWLLNQAIALETENFDLLETGFINLEFLGINKRFLLIAPYKSHREGGESTKLTAILGQVIEFDYSLVKKLKNSLRLEFGELHQEVPIILPYKSMAVSGNVGGESHEAFVVANNWVIKNSVQGTSLHDMSEQHRRFLNSGQKCIRRIWEKETAEFLISTLLDEDSANSNRSLEYQLHEFGHASGFGLERKIQENLFSRDYWNASVEESRSDGVELELAARELSQEEAGKVIVVNFCVRQALDAHRRGGLNRDGDVGASLLNFSFLWESGEVSIKNGQLYLRDLSYEGLLRAVRPHREWAMRLTRKELNLDYLQGLFRLYGSVSVHPAVEEMFQGLVVEPCKGIFKELR